MPEIDSAISVPVSNRQTGGLTGGWNEDKTKFAVMRSQGANQTIRDFLTYVDCSNPNPSLWVLAPDIVEVPRPGGAEVSRQLKFLPPEGDVITYIYVRQSPFNWVVCRAALSTGVLTTIDYPVFFPGFVGDIKRHAYSADGQWAAYNMDGNAPNGDGCFIFRRSDGALMYHDPVAVNDDYDYLLHHFPEDSGLFVYMSGTTVKKVSTQTWTVVASQAFPSEPRPDWVSPGGLFYTGGRADDPAGGRIWDSSFNVVFSDPNNGVVFDWNQAGDRTWGAVDARKYAITTPGYVTTDVGLITNEGGYRMRPWL